MMEKIKIEIEVLLHQAVSNKARAVIFDAEEEDIYCYFLTHDELQEIKKLPKDYYEYIIKEVNKLEKQKYSWGESDFLMLNYSTLTNFGERLVLQLIEQDKANNDSALKEVKINITRDINKFLPATSLTHKNVINLIKLIKKYSPFKTQKLHNLMHHAGLGGEIKIGLPKKQITSIIGSWLEVPYIDLEEVQINEDVLKILPKEVCMNLKAVPFKIEQDVLFIAMFDPLDKDSAREIENIVKKNIKLFISAEEDIRMSFLGK